MSAADASAEARIAIEFISVLGMPPADFVHVAADLGCRNIGIALTPIVANPAYARWSLREDAGLRRDFTAALRDRDVSISVGEGFVLMPGADAGGTTSDLDLMADLGVRRVNVLTADPDRARGLDTLAAFATLAAARGMATTLEFLPGMPIADVAGALAALDHAGIPSFRLMLDTMHVFRSGSTLADIAALDPARIGYVQVCDVPRVSTHASYADEARYDRLPPGEGELPLAAFLKLIPRDVIVGLELPMMAKAAVGISAHDRLAGSVATVRAMLAA